MLIRIDRSKLIRFMFDKAMTASDLARRADVSMQAVRNAIEGKKLQIPSAAKIAKVLDIPADDFIIFAHI